MIMGFRRQAAQILKTWSSTHCHHHLKQPTIVNGGGPQSAQGPLFQPPRDSSLLVPGKKYPQTGGSILYERSYAHRCLAYIFQIPVCGYFLPGTSRCDLGSSPRVQVVLRTWTGGGMLILSQEMPPDPSWPSSRHI